MIAVIVADADEFHLLRSYFQLRELVDHGDFGSYCACAYGLTGIPHHVIVAVLYEIAAVDELQLEFGIRKRCRRSEC